MPQKVVTVVVLSKDDNSENKLTVSNGTPINGYVLQVTGDPVVEIDSIQIVTPGIGLGLQILSNVMINDLSKESLGSLLLWGKPTVEGNRRRYRIEGNVSMNM